MVLITNSWTEFAAAIAFPVESVAVFIVAMFVSVVSVSVVSSLSLLPAKMVYILLFCVVYPILPAMLRNCCAKMRRVNAPPMKVLSAGYVLGVMASQSSNYFNGKMFAFINKQTALLMI